MMSTMFRSLALATALGVLTVLGADSASGQAGKAPPGGGKAPAADKAPAAKESPANAEVELKAIKLAHASPEEVRDTLSSVWPALVTARRLPNGGTAAKLSVAADARTKTLFVRGTDKQLGMVEQLVKILDTAPDQELPTGTGLTVVRLKHAKVDEVTQVLAGLGLQQQVIALPRQNALILPQAERQAKDIRMVIENVDTEGKTKKTTQTKTSAAKQ
jgi:type II secretory pathway component GspD/PulD (secretin)